MNSEFKKEFQLLNKDDIKEIVNKCAHFYLLQKDITKCLDAYNNEKYVITYVDDENYGFYAIQWDWQDHHYNNWVIGGSFKSQIKLTPFNVTHDINGINPFNANSKKQLQEYLFLYISKKCPHYKQAIVEETQKFLNMLYGKNDNQQSL